MIELHNLSVGYGKQTVLQNVSAAFEKGKLTAVIGANGCGKSTLLKSVLGIIPATDGHITIEDVPLDTMTRTEIARKIAYLSQGKNTPDMTVAQLVLHGRFPHLNYPRRYTKRDHEIARSAMEQTGIAKHANKPLSDLSGGMRQTAYIAMALAQDTDYVILDEPTTYLDISHQLELMRTLRALADSGKGIVTVMHDLPMAFTFSDKIILINEGKILCDEVPSQVFKTDAIAQVFGISLTRSEDSGAYSYKY